MLAKTNKKPFPLIFKIFYSFALISGMVYLVFLSSPHFSDFINQTIGTFLRILFAKLTSWIPFSLAEWLLLTVPVWIVILIVAGSLKYCKTWRQTGFFIASLISVLLLILSLFVWTLAPGNFGSRLESKLDLERTESSAEELSQTALLMSSELELLTKDISFLETGFSMMPYSVSELSDKLVLSFDSFLSEHPIFRNFDSRVKPIMMSEPMSYTHITGIYTYFTGEANINVDFPDYTIPFTAAHEMAHQRGIAREDEANFVAFLVCVSSDDPYIRYSGYLSTYEYVCSALFQADPERYVSVLDALPNEILEEEYAYSSFLDKYRDSGASKVAEAVNDNYLKSQGNPQGTRSYNLMVDLAVAYYRPFFPDD